MQRSKITTESRDNENKKFMPKTPDVYNKGQEMEEGDVEQEEKANFIFHKET